MRPREWTFQVDKSGNIVRNKSDMRINLETVSAVEKSAYDQLAEALVLAKRQRDEWNIKANALEMSGISKEMFEMVCIERDELELNESKMNAALSAKQEIIDGQKIEIEKWRKIEELSGLKYVEIFGEVNKLKRGKYGKPVDWPGNKCDCTDPENIKIHDALCEMLEAMAYNEYDVCTASVGIWGAIQVCREMWAKGERMIEKLKALCCGFEFWGWNHSPEHNGVCRACTKKWIGAKAIKPEVTHE